MNLFDYYFNYDLDVKLFVRNGEGIQARSSGEIPLKHLVDEAGNISYEGESVLTHVEIWDRIGSLPTQPSLNFALHIDFKKQVMPK